jgi:HK97 family phage prohead protease
MDGVTIVNLYSRSWAVSDLEVSRAGDGRTVTAYAAVFDTPAEIQDQHGHYIEVIDRAAFNRTLGHGIARVGVFYHHGMTLHGTPSDLGSVPIGRPLDIVADGRGLKTVSRFNNSQLADAALEAIRAGDITGYSFRGRIFRSSPDRVPRGRAGDLPTVTRHELGLAEYGPTPTPAYAEAGILAVRSTEQLAADLAALDEDARNELIDLLRTISATPTDPAEPATPTPGPGAVEAPHPVHAIDISDVRRKARVGAILRGMR